MRIDEYVGFDGLGLAALIRGGEVSAAELLDTALAQAVATDGLGAVVDVQEAVARASIAGGLPAGAFTGVPFLLKDLGCEAIDFPTSMGSGLFREHRYGYDSELYTRLRAAGLVTFGRTASPELGIGPTTEAKAFQAAWSKSIVAAPSVNRVNAAVLKVARYPWRPSASVAGELPPRLIVYLPAASTHVRAASCVVPFSRWSRYVTSSAHSMFPRLLNV